VITATDLVNKIGTAQIAISAHEPGPASWCGRDYKFSPNDLGELVTSRSAKPGGLADISKYSHVRVRNPAFDVTPPVHRLICTEVEPYREMAT